MRELALFAGAGGGILGGVLLGWRTVCAVELDAYCRRVLLARQHDGHLPPFPVWDDVTTFDGRPWRGSVDVISGGFPCQDISCAGKGAGITGERSGLWTEFARIIREVGPRYVFVENSPMLTSRGLGVVLGDLASLGFDARWGVLGAVHVGAPHRRLRIWIVAVSNATGRGREVSALQEQCGELAKRSTVGADSASVCNPNGESKSVESVNDEVAILRGDAADADGAELREQSRRRSRESGPGEAEPGDDGAQGCVADAEGNGRQSRRTGDSAQEPRGRKPDRGGVSEDVRDSDGARLAQRQGEPRDDGTQQPTAERASWWDTEPDVGRVANELASELDEDR